MIELDKRIQLQAPAGLISEAGIDGISQFIYAQRLESEAWQRLNPTLKPTMLPG